MGRNKENYSIKIKNNFNETLNILKDMDSITNVKIQNKQISSNLKEMNDGVDKTILYIKDEIAKLENDLSWDKVNIAFFGETNAGKSTIIEAITRGNGESIGNGRKDYTKETTSIEYKDKNLLDLPGMEGEEDKYIQEIKTGINKAHYVFYVSDTNKEPEEGVLKKIKGYLNEQTNIYSIINIRQMGLPKNKKSLMNEAKEIVLKRTDEKFKQIFGSHYQGIIPIHAELAYRIRKEYKDETTIKKLEKAEKVFGDLQDVYNYTNFEEIIKAINNTNMKEIAIANTYKFLNISGNIILNIKESKKTLHNQINSIEKEFNKAKRSVKNEVDNYYRNIKELVDVDIIKLQNKIKDMVVAAGVEGWDERTGEKKLNETLKKFDNELQQKIQTISDNLNERIIVTYKEMNNQIKLESKFTKFSEGFIKVDDIISKFSMSIKNVMGGLGSMLITTVSALFSGWIGLIIGGVTAIFGLVKWFKVDKNKAQSNQIKKAHKEIENKIKEIKINIDKSLESDLEEFTKEINHKNKTLENNIKKLRDIGETLSKYIQSFIKIEAITSKDLIEYIENKDYEYVYMDCKTKNLFYIGEPLENTKFYNIDSIESYDGLEAFYFENEFNITKNNIDLKKYNDFQKKALLGLSNHLKTNYNKEFEISGEI